MATAEPDCRDRESAPSSNVMDGGPCHTRLHAVISWSQNSVTQRICLGQIGGALAWHDIYDHSIERASFHDSASVGTGLSRTLNALGGLWRERGIYRKR